MAVVQIFSLLLLIHPVNLCGFQRIRMSSHPAVMVGTESKAPALISRIAIVTRVLPRIDRIGGAIAIKSAQPMIGRTEILGGTNLLGGTKIRPNGIGTIVLGGTLQNRSPKGEIENGTVHRRRVIIRLLV
jgi:hypothetical protein